MNFIFIILIRKVLDGLRMDKGQDEEKVKIKQDDKDNNTFVIGDNHIIWFIILSYY
jgi:hypothetical protein